MLFSIANKTIYSLDVQGLDRHGLQVLSFEGLESLNAEYSFEITLINKHLRFDITQLLSKPAYLSFTSDKSKGIHGVIHSVKRCSIGNQYAHFKVILAPRFSHLYKRFNQRKFVNKSVPEIISTLLNENGIQQGDNNGFIFKFKDPNVYQPREFCVQYDENDAHFIHRLCEEEGISQHYEFTQHSHQLIFADAQPFFPSLAGAIKYKSDTGFVADEQVIKRFDVNLSSATQLATWRDYNFKNAKIPEGTKTGQQSEKANQANEPALEHYDYPSTGMTKARNEQLANIEIERLRAKHLLAEAYSDVPSLHAGYFFTIEDYPLIDTLDASLPWLINQIRHQGRQPQVLEEFGGEHTAAATTSASQLINYFRHPIAEELQFPFADFEQGYRNCLIASPQQVTYRPQRLHPKPKVLGSQTAIVTGAIGEEIYCDEYGRVKVQFHWDREGNYDENSSHWIRVASNWAHKGYGSVIMPRVGMEVKVDFLEGNPDNPIITGAIHNGKNKVPYDLPAHKTKSVFKTSSSKGGIGSNELRIEDKAGQEQIFVQAQKDYDQLTKHNHIIQVNNNSHLQVQNEYSQTVVANRYQQQMAEEHHLTLKDRKTQILQNDYKQVGMAEHTSIGTIKTTQAGIEIHLKSGLQTIIDGGLSLTLKAGGQHIILNPAGIWMTNPVWPGGLPMEGTPAAPIPPMTKQYGVPSTTSPIVKTLTMPTARATNQLLPAQEQDNPPEIIKKLRVIISPLPNVVVYRKQPYKLYADGALKQQGLTDEEGAAEFDFIPTINKYEIELINGHRFEIEFTEQQQELSQADNLGLFGHRSYVHNEQHLDTLKEITDYRLEAIDPLSMVNKKGEA